MLINICIESEEILLSDNRAEYYSLEKIGCGSSLNNVSSFERSLSVET